MKEEKERKGNKSRDSIDKTTLILDKDSGKKYYTYKDNKITLTRSYPNPAKYMF